MLVLKDLVSMLKQRERNSVVFIDYVEAEREITMIADATRELQP